MARKKMTAYDLLNMECYFFEERKVHRLDDKTIKGIRYTLDNRLTDEQKEIILSYKNTEVGTCHYRYAPEIKYDTVIILNKCIRKNEVK